MSRPSSSEAANALALIAAYAQQQGDSALAEELTRTSEGVGKRTRSSTTAELDLSSLESANLLRAITALSNSTSSSTGALHTHTMELFNSNPGFLPTIAFAPPSPGSHDSLGPSFPRHSSTSYTPLPTRSGRIPQAPDPADIDRDTMLFNDYLWYPSDDDEDPDFEPRSDKDAVWGDILVGGPESIDGTPDAGTGMFSEEDNETDYSAFDDPVFPRVDPYALPISNNKPTPIDTTSLDSLLNSQDIFVPSLSTDNDALACLPGVSTPAVASTSKRASSSSKPPPSSSSSSTTISTKKPRGRLSKRARTTLSPLPEDPLPKPGATPSISADSPADPAKPPKEKRKTGRPPSMPQEESAKRRKERQQAYAAEKRQAVKDQMAADAARLIFLEGENTRLRARVKELEEEESSEGSWSEEEERVETPGMGGRPELSEAGLRELTRLMQWAASAEGRGMG